MLLNKSFSEYPCTAAVTKGYAVSINSSGAVTLSATATLGHVIGIACNTTTAAGEFVTVQTHGLCDFVVGSETITAGTDYGVRPIDGGKVAGVTVAESVGSGVGSMLMIGKIVGTCSGDGATGTVYIQL